MLKNRKVQLVYLSAACTVGVLGLLASMGLFEAEFRWDFYVYFTTISNFFCVAVMFAELSRVLGSKEDGYINACPRLKFVGFIGIVLTFAMFNAVMAPEKSAEYLLSFRSFSLHVLIPVLYIADWFLFYERGKTTRIYPLLAVLFPISYIVFVFIHAAAFRFDSSILCFAGDAPLIYPYFFLDYEKLGGVGLAVWIIAVIAVLLVVGYLFFFLDTVLGKLSSKKRRESEESMKVLKK